MARTTNNKKKASEHSDKLEEGSPKLKWLSSNKVFLLIRSILLQMKSFFNEHWLKKSILLLIHFSPVACIIWALFVYSTNPFSTENLAVAAVLIIINISFFVYAGFFKKTQVEETTYTAYFTLMIFNVGIFPLFNYIKDYHERNKEEIKFTIGFRSWGASVEYSNIKVFYYDKFGNPYSLADSTVNNPDNWITRIWTEMNITNKKDLSAKPGFDKKGDTLFISLINCGAVLNPKVFDKDKVTSFSVSADIHYVETDSLYINAPKSERYESTQICLRVPYYVNSGDKNYTDSSEYKEIYYGFELPFWNFSWSKLRIPAFNFDYTEAELYYRVMNNPNDQYARHIIKGIKETILYDTINEQVSPIAPGATIRLSSSLIGDNASFYMYKTNSTHSLPLFNFRIPDYSEIELE